MRSAPVINAFAAIPAAAVGSRTTRTDRTTTQRELMPQCDQVPGDNAVTSRTSVDAESLSDSLAGAAALPATGGVAVGCPASVIRTIHALVPPLRKNCWTP